MLQTSDSIEDITGLLHKAYRPLAEAGMRFYASHQSARVTRQRCEDGECWLAFDEARLIGTITWRRGSAQEGAVWYRRPEVAIFGQFAIEPSLQRAGLGTQLLQKIEGRAREAGLQELSCDTAETAHHLITYYTRLGFRPVDEVQWEVTNYRSVILSKALS